MKHATFALHALFFVGPCFSEPMEDPISQYLIDVGGGTVAASGIISLDNSAVRTIQSAQDIALAFKPFNSTDNKSGFGVAITPARTTLLPLKGTDYYHNVGLRIFGNLTLSYAQNEVDVGDKSYRRYGYSVDTYYYFDPNKDPTIAFSTEWKKCADMSRSANNEFLQRLRDKYPAAFRTPIDAAQKATADKDLQEFTADRMATLKDCADKAPSLAIVDTWNAGRVAISFGDGRISVKGADQRYSLGKRLTVNALFPVTKVGAVNVSVQRVRNALDLESLKSTSPDFKTSTLAGIRYTHVGSEPTTRTHGLFELSNSKSSSNDAFKDVFMHAAGIDYRVIDSKETPLWLSLRVGRNRSVASGDTQTTALLTLNFQRATTIPDPSKSAGR